MIGTIEDAKRALSLPGRMSEYYLDAGSSRMAYLINGIVYKTEYYHGENRMEHYNLSRNIDLPEGVHYPKCSLFTIDDNEVIAMEYIEGQAIASCYCTDEPHTDYCMTAEEYAILSRLFSDTSGLNVIRRDGQYWIIDLAE